MNSENYKQDMLTTGTKLLFLSVGIAFLLGSIFVTAELASDAGQTAISEMLEEYYVIYIYINTLFIMLYVLYLFRFIFRKIFKVKI